MDRNDILRSIENHRTGLAPLLTAYEDLTKATKGTGEGGKDRAFTAEEWGKHEALGLDINRLNSAIATDRAALRALNLSEATDDQTAAVMGLSDRSKLPTATDEYMDSFLAFAQGGFSAQGCDPEKYRNLTTVAPSTGGVLIPTELETTILMEAAVLCPLLRISNVEMTSTLHSQIPFMGEIGVMGPRKEAEAYTLNEPALSVKSLDIFNYGGFFPVSQELMEDAPQLQSAFREVWARAYAQTIEEYGWKGTGGQTAFFNQAGSGITITLAGRVCPGIRTLNSTIIPVVPFASATAVGSDDLIKLKQAVVPEARSGGTYVFSGDLETKALLLKDTTGRPLWQPSIIAGQPSMINGSPYEVSSRLDAMAASANPAFFGNFKQGHKIAIRKGLTVKTSGHYLFGNGMIAVAGDTRWGAGVKYNGYIARGNNAAS
ncbi:phage major capsid protein [Luteolibacter sp. GHJ8]|uniref:Phage major capsid protein n=1 Tax=Luteolibacter rhizosphaerae TaxID=2989719 RepID=A0ABT3GAZ0_9BACT|nr:phage major capsid protein [Luteolibacter rhizosphaerae]MCW1916787.1 phage major capsid protein [Luteolibacter rhizosphaerae]